MNTSVITKRADHFFQSNFQRLDWVGLTYLQLTRSKSANSVWNRFVRFQQFVVTGSKSNTYDLLANNLPSTLNNLQRRKTYRGYERYFQSFFISRKLRVRRRTYTYTQYRPVFEDPLSSYTTERYLYKRFQKRVFYPTKLLNMSVLKDLYFTKLAKTSHPNNVPYKRHLR